MDSCQHSKHEMSERQNDCGSGNDDPTWGRRDLDDAHCRSVVGNERGGRRRMGYPRFSFRRSITDPIDGTTGSRNALPEATVFFEKAIRLCRIYSGRASGLGDMPINRLVSIGRAPNYCADHDDVSAGRTLECFDRVHFHVSLLVERKTILVQKWLVTSVH